MNPIDCRDRESLARAIRSGARPSYLFFWGHRPLPDGRIRASCLSQWWPAEFEVDGVRFRTAEHFMMAEKARLFGDDAARSRIVAAADPAQAKKLGRAVQGFDQALWEAARFEIVVRGNTAKFEQDPRLRGFLLDTRGRVLVEASPVDSIWGIGLAADHPDAISPERWKGLNLLGFALMEARRLLT